jgi:hypothetical protein
MLPTQHQRPVHNDGEMYKDRIDGLIDSYPEYMLEGFSRSKFQLLLLVFVMAL